MDNFLINSEETGRQIITSIRTGRKYYVEAIGEDRSADWGSVNPATGTMENKKGTGKHRGSISPSNSLITEENGFKNITTLSVGESPYAFIEKIDKEYVNI